MNAFRSRGCSGGFQLARREYKVDRASLRSVISKVILINTLDNMELNRKE